MPVQYSEIQELLRSRADLHARLNLMPYDGTPEIKERGDKKRLFLRKKSFLDQLHSNPPNIRTVLYFA